MSCLHSRQGRIENPVGRGGGWDEQVAVFVYISSRFFKNASACKSVVVGGLMSMVSGRSTRSS